MSHPPNNHGNEPSTDPAFWTNDVDGFELRDPPMDDRHALAQSSPYLPLPSRNFRHLVSLGTIPGMPSNKNKVMVTFGSNPNLKYVVPPPKRRSNKRRSLFGKHEGGAWVKRARTNATGAVSVGQPDRGEVAGADGADASVDNAAGPLVDLDSSAEGGTQPGAGAAAISSSDAVGAGSDAGADNVVGHLNSVDIDSSAKVQDGKYSS